MEIDGLWISDYMISADSNKIPFDTPIIIYAERDSIFIKAMENRNLGLDGNESRTTFNYTENGFKLKGIDLEELFITKVSKDSMVLDLYNDEVKEVFRRLTPTEIPMNWSPSNKSYYWDSNTSKINTKFIGNDLFVDYNRKTDYISIGQWETFSLKKHTLLNRNILYPQVFHIDSIKQNKIHLSIFDRKKYNYVLKEYSPKMPKELLGEWIFVGSKYINENLPPPSLYPINQNKKTEIECLKIELDSIKIIKNGVSKTNKWVLGGVNNLLIFPDPSTSEFTFSNDSILNKRLRINESILKIERLTDKELELLSDYDSYEFDGFTRKLIFKRKK